MAGREGEHTLAATSDDQWWTGLLHRSRRERVAEHLVVLSVEVKRPVRMQEALDDLGGLLEAGHPQRGMVVGQTRFVVVRAHPARAEAELETTVAQHVERGRLLGEHERMAVVVAEDERAHAQARRRPRHCGESGNRGELITEVVGHEEGAVAEVLGFAGLLGPRARRSIGRGAQLRGEAKLPVVCHCAIVPENGPAGPFLRCRRGGSSERSRCSSK